MTGKFGTVLKLQFTITTVYPKVDQFNYLKSLVEGNAVSAIEGFALTADNYESAVKLLNDKFSDP